MAQQPAQQQVAAGPSQAAPLSEFVVLPPGPINRHKRHMLAKFMQANPGLTAGSNHQWRLVPEKVPEKTRNVGPRTSIANKPQGIPPPLNLERTAAPGESIQRGLPEGGAAMPPPTTTTAGVPASPAASYYLFIKAGKGAITAYPVDLIYGFKPPYRKSNVSLEDAEAKMRADREAADSLGSLKMVPKSLRTAAEKLADEQAGVGPKNKGISVEQALAQLFGENEGDDDIVAPGQKRRGGGRGAGRGRGRGRAVRGADGAELDVEEVAEDIYAGLEGEGGEQLRPAKPEPAEDWEHQHAASDDDLAQGGTDSENLEDDPKFREKLGLQGGSDDEAEKEEDEAIKKLKKLIKKEEEGEDDDEEEVVGDVASQDVTATDAALGDEEDDLDLDVMASQLAGPPAAQTGGKRKQSESGAADNGAKRARIKPENGSTPVKTEPGIVKKEPGANRPTGTAAAAAGRGSTPPPSVKSPPVKSEAIKQEAGRAGTPGPTGTPLAAPTADDIKQAVLAAGGSVPMNKLREMFAARLRGPGLLDQFKKNMMAVLKLAEAPDGSKLLQLK